MQRYDAGLLNDYGGGNVGWWHDYIRHEIERCNDFHEQSYTEAQAEIDRLTAENGRLREALNSIANDDMAVCDSCDAYQETARAALEGGEHEQT